MKSAEFLLKTITFSQEGLKLEDIIRLIYLDKTSSKFDKNLESIIKDLRKYSKHIKCIGYAEDFIPGTIRIRFCFNLNDIPLDEFKAIGQ